MVSSAGPTSKSTTHNGLNSEPILFVQTAFLGDLLLSIPTLKRLRYLFPEKKIFLVCRKGLGSFLKQLDVCDQIYEVAKKDRSSYLATQKQLSQIQFDKIICPHESLTSAFFSKKLSAKDRYSFIQWWNFIFFNHRIVKPLKRPEALRQMSLLTEFDQDLDLKLNSLPQDQSLFAVPDWASPQVLPWLGNEKSIAIFPGSVWPTKKWTISGFQKVAQHFHDLGFQINLLGSEQEKEICQQIGQNLERAVNYAGRLSLMESLLILQKSQVCISNDSGGQHMASLCGTPTVSIFGPTVLSQGFRPWNTRIEIAELENLKCRPCGKHGHKKCPIGTHECMEKLDAQVVIKKTKKLLPALT